MTSLLDIWLSQKEFLEAKPIDQLISISGDGNLRDGNEASVQLRSLFANIPAVKLTRYIDECLGSPVKQGGLVLQDLVNEVGSRLGFSIEPGYYRGGGNKIGFDGIWRAKDGYAFIVEVKITDTYQINLDIQANYRERLIEQQKIDEDMSSILIIVGRQDTGGLEAQTRGSKHAWDARIIGIEALLKLLLVKENLSGSNTVQKIQEILKPLEYTRVDRLIDIIFSTSEDLQTDDSQEELPGKQDQSGPMNYHEACVNRISEHLTTPLIRQGRCTYTNADRDIRVLCIVSKEYERSGAIRYWYAFHPNQQEFLDEGESSFITFGCGSADQVICMPISEFKKNLGQMRATDSDNRFYWHVEIFQKNGKLLLNSPTDQGVDITHHLIR